MEEILHNISIKRFKSRFPDMPGAALRDDLLIADLRYDKALSVFKYPFRFDGYIIIFCISGRIQLEVNLDAFQVGSNSLVLNVPGNIIRVSGVETDERNLHFIVVAISVTTRAVAGASTNCAKNQKKVEKSGAVWGNICIFDLEISVLY